MDRGAGEEACRVIRTLRKQIKLVRAGQSLYDGKLIYFREAITMEGFNVVVRQLMRIPECKIFSTLREIEAMEEAIRNHDSVELDVQCCMILYFCEHLRPNENRLPDPASELSWPFGSCGSLEEIAYLRSRLRFVGSSSYLREVLNISLVHAVEKCFRKHYSAVNWQGLLLVFKEARPACTYRLFMFLSFILQDKKHEIPTAAATLFLSYVSCAIYILSANLGNYHCPVEEKMISALLELGASPLISMEHHHVLFERLKEHFQTKRSPWWMESENRAAGPMERHPTVLNRLLAHEWSPEFWEIFAKHTCCSLDAVDAFKRNYAPKKVLSLKCLAAQKLRGADLEALSTTMKFMASKHQPILLQNFAGLR